MRRFAFSVAVALAFAGPGAAQPNTTGVTTPEAIRGSSTKQPSKKANAAANQERSRQIATGITNFSGSERHIVPR